MTDEPGPFARKPAALAHEEAAVLARMGTIALRALRLAVVPAGARVLVTDAGRDVGAIAVQIAKARGHHVTGVCSERAVPLVWDLGADEVYACDRVPRAARFTAIIDTDHTITAALAAQLLTPGGRLIMTCDATRASPPTDPELQELADLVERHGVFPL